MADEPEEPGGLAGDAVGASDGTEAQVSALAELALCENLAQTSGWAARWSATMAGADATLLWAPDTVHPIFLCIGAEGQGVEKFLRRSAPRDTGYIHELVRDRQPIVLAGDELTTNDPFVRGLSGYRACIAVPLEAEGLVVGLLAIFFIQMPNAEQALARLERFLEQAAPALGRALRSERKTVGMLHAIERLTNLYDLSKAFGSTIDIDELSTLIVRKAADFVTGETACLWMLEGEDDVIVAGSAGQRELRRRVAARRRGRRARRRRRGRPGFHPPQPDPRGRPGRDRESRPTRSARRSPCPSSRTRFPSGRSSSPTSGGATPSSRPKTRSS